MVMKRGLQPANNQLPARSSRSLVCTGAAKGKFGMARGAVVGKERLEVSGVPMPWDSPPAFKQSPLLQPTQTPAPAAQIISAQKPRVFLGGSGDRGPPFPGYPGVSMPSEAQIIHSKQLSESLKRQRRLEKNRESARECRRRKKERVERLSAQISAMEQENLQLRLRLKIGTEAAKRERREKQSVLNKLQDRLGKGATDAELSSLIHDYKDKFSDYGKNRTSALEFHLKELEKLVLPTNTTRLCIWGMGQAGDFLHNKEQGDKKTVAKSELEPSQQEKGVAAQRRDEQKQTARRFWNIISSHLGLSEDQQRAIIGYRHSVCELEEDLEQLHKVIDELGQLITNKNETLDKEMEDLQRILTPTQIAKFMLWVKQNPGCMYMLNQLWKQVYQNS